MGSLHHLGEVERLVLLTVRLRTTTTSAIAHQVGYPVEAVTAAVVRLVHDGFVETTGEAVTVTDKGRLVAEQLERSGSTSSVGSSASTVDVGEVARFIGNAWSAHTKARAASRDNEQNSLLASDEDRDVAVQLLADAFSQGRLSSSEFSDRTDRALAATTYGQLDDVLQGLGGLRRPVASRPARKAVFGLVALLSSPFVLFGWLLLTFGDDAGDRVAGIVFLVLLLPGLFALRGWAWRR